VYRYTVAAQGHAVVFSQFLTGGPRVERTAFPAAHVKGKNFLRLRKEYNIQIDRRYAPWTSTTVVFVLEVA
jgi:hypothetical protein